MIYKILDAQEWQKAKSAGTFKGSTIDLHDGYIHFSTSGQMIETAAKHFRGCEELVLLSVEPTTLGPELKWEPSRGGALFPHLYGPLDTSKVVRVDRLPWNGNNHVFPVDLT